MSAFHNYVKLTSLCDCKSLIVKQHLGKESLLSNLSQHVLHKNNKKVKKTEATFFKNLISPNKFLFYFKHGKPKPNCMRSHDFLFLMQF